MPLPTISDAEWEVMNVLWDASPRTANDVVNQLAARRGWNPRTVKTLLNRLVNKRALAFEAQGKRYLYHPVVSRDQCVRAESRSFVARVFGGAVGPMLAHFVSQADLTADEIEQLKRVLAEKGRKPTGRKGKKP